MTRTQRALYAQRIVTVCLAGSLIAIALPTPLSALAPSGIKDDQRRKEFLSALRQQEEAHATTTRSVVTQRVDSRGTSTRQPLLHLLSSVTARPAPVLDMNFQTRMPPGVADFMLTAEAWDTKGLMTKDVRRLRLPEWEAQLIQTVEAMIREDRHVELVNALADWAEMPYEPPKWTMMAQLNAARHAFIITHRGEPLPGLNHAMEDMEMQMRGRGHLELFYEGRSIPAPDTSAYEWFEHGLLLEGVDEKRIKHATRLMARLRCGFLTRQEESALTGFMIAQDSSGIPHKESSKKLAHLLYTARMVPDFPKVLARVLVADRVSRVLAKVFLDHPIPNHLPQESKDLVAQLLGKLVPADPDGLRRNLDILHKLGLLDLVRLRPLLDYPRGAVKAELLLYCAGKSVADFFDVWENALWDKRAEVRSAALEAFYITLREKPSHPVDTQKHRSAWDKDAIRMFRRIVYEFLRNGSAFERKRALEEILRQRDIFWNAEDMVGLMHMLEDWRKDTLLKDDVHTLQGVLFMMRVQLPEETSKALSDPQVSLDAPWSLEDILKMIGLRVVGLDLNAETGAEFLAAESSL